MNMDEYGWIWMNMDEYGNAKLPEKVAEFYGWIYV